MVIFIISLTLVYQEESNDLKNIWIDNIVQDITYFTIISTS